MWQEHVTLKVPVTFLDVAVVAVAILKTPAETVTYLLQKQLLLQ